MNRKSSRVKRLKTFKDEIVYYPPSSSKTYNIDQQAIAIPDTLLKSKRKPSVDDKPVESVSEVAMKKSKTNNKQATDVEVVTEPVPEKLKKKTDNSKKARIQSYLQKSVRLAKSKKASVAASRKLLQKNVDSEKSTHNGKLTEVGSLPLFCVERIWN